MSASGEAALVAVVYHSARGHTRVLAEAVARGVARVAGARAALLPVESVDWDTLARADAIVFGCPTFMGGPSAAMKAFMDASSHRAWATRAWKDKLAAGFTNSSAMSGDKLGTLVSLALFAAQHDMVWVGLGLRPGNNTSRGSDEDLNRLGSHLGAMAQSDLDAAPDAAPPASDRRTAEHLGERVARAALRWATGVVSTEAHDAGRHPTTKHWVFPPAARAPVPAPVERTNLRELAARPGRFEHHLTVVARVGAAQLEIATASEPLYFAHQNVGDEYTVALGTGDALLEGVPYLTLFSDPATGDDVGRVRQHVGDWVLHPAGLLHWPGRLRPPWETFVFGPGERRTGLSLVYCASRPTPVSPARPLFVSAGREGDVKAYGARDALPAVLADTRGEPARLLGAVGDSRLELLVGPALVAPPQGGYLLVLEAAPDGQGGFFAGDLLYLPAGARLETAGVGRALLATRLDGPPEPPPDSWRTTPAPPFPVYEDAPPGALPFALGALRFEPGASAATTRVALGDHAVEVPRYWLARMLFRVALHGYALGYLETYNGFFWDDRDGAYRLGLRGAGSVTIGDRELASVIEQLYRAVAPHGYTERLV